ncbi:MAG TPA: DNA recombination protein RmuC, partial [Dehalococcoidia bacterium]|nr:DNA recombination protein RmuC [Dehalococcoidia bacterium]
MLYLGIFLGGLILGLLIAFLVNHFNRKQVEKTFTYLSTEALRNNTQDFLQLAGQTLSSQTKAGEIELEGKKKLIDGTLDGIKIELQNIEKLVKDYEKDRAAKFGELNGQLSETARQTARLQETTAKLQGALASTKARGQWGEKIAEDVLRLAGFSEGINYLKQQTMDSGTSRPDFTFLLPQGLKLNMDVKFPLNNYLNYCNEESETDRQSYKAQFLRDARQRIREVTTKDYIDPEGKTVDCVLVFIPNEQVYGFIHENDHAIFDEALQKRVILCSPFTLYAIISVIRQAVEIFNTQKTMDEILGIFGQFNRQWELFKASMDKMGKRIDDASREYAALLTTRSTGLERPLRKIDELRARNSSIFLRGLS